MTVPLKFNANLTLLFTEVRLVERFQKAKDAGFDAVELLSNEGVEFSVLKSAANKANIEVVLCNAPVGDFPTGGLGLSGVPGRQKEFMEGIEQVAMMVSNLNCKKIQIGPSRIPEDVSRAECIEVFESNLLYAANKLESQGIKLLVEPLNSVDIPDILIDDIDLASQLINQCKATNVELQFDIYHLTRMGKSIEYYLNKYKKDIGHIQFADCPGRAEPGQGDINFDNVFTQIRSIKYQGWIGAEYNPSLTTMTSLDWLTSFQGNEKEIDEQ